MGEWLAANTPEGRLYQYPFCGKPATSFQVKGTAVLLCGSHVELVESIDPDRDAMDVEVEEVDTGPVVFHRPSRHAGQ